MRLTSACACGERTNAAIGLAGHGNVVGVAAGAADQPQILETGQRPADVRTAVGRVCCGPFRPLGPRDAARLAKPARALPIGRNRRRDASAPRERSYARSANQPQLGRRRTECHRGAIRENRAGYGCARSRFVARRRRFSGRRGEVDRSRRAGSQPGYRRENERIGPRYRAKIASAVRSIAKSRSPPICSKCWMCSAARPTTSPNKSPTN